MTAAVPLILAGANLVIWSLVLVISVRDYHAFRDERAARGVLLALVLAAAAIGSFGSALGYYLSVMGSEILPASLIAQIARGAMIVGGAAYLSRTYSRHRRRQ
jgi:hypothetical protein